MMHTKRIHDPFLYFTGHDSHLFTHPIGAFSCPLGPFLHPTGSFSHPMRIFPGPGGSQKADDLKRPQNCPVCTGYRFEQEVKAVDTAPRSLLKVQQRRPPALRSPLHPAAFRPSNKLGRRPFKSQGWACRLIGSPVILSD